jgi:hypothetical protein
MAKIPRNIFKKLELELEEEAPPLRVVRVGVITVGGEEERWVLGSFRTAG